MQTMEESTTCEKCKPSQFEDESSVAPEVCKMAYQQVLACMKSSKGSISQCNSEWSTFKECYQSEKVKPRVIHSK